MSIIKELIASHAVYGDKSDSNFIIVQGVAVPYRYKGEASMLNDYRTNAAIRVAVEGLIENLSEKDKHYGGKVLQMFMADAAAILAEEAQQKENG